MPRPKTAPTSHSKPAPRKRLARSDREEQMIGVAIDLFVIKGYQGTSIEDIASAAGVTRPILYKLFGSKDNIYLACLKRARECLNQRLTESAASEGSFADRLRAGIDGYFDFVERNRESWRLLFGGGAAIAGSAAEEAKLLRFNTVNMIAELLRPFVGDADRAALELQAHALSGAAEQIAKWWLENPQVKREVVVDRLTRLMWPGFEQLAALHGASR